MIIPNYHKHIIHSGSKSNIVITIDVMAHQLRDHSALNISTYDPAGFNNLNILFFIYPNCNYILFYYFYIKDICGISFIIIIKDFRILKKYASTHQFNIFIISKII